MKNFRSVTEKRDLKRLLLVSKERLLRLNLRMHILSIFLVSGKKTVTC